VFDFLTDPSLASMFQGTAGGGDTAKTAQQKTPPPPRAAASSEPFAEAQPAGAMSDVFSGMVDAAPSVAKEPAPTAHTISPYHQLGRPDFLTADPLEFLGDATPQNMARAAATFNGEVFFNEGHDVERKANRMQDGYRASHTAENEGGMNIGLGGRAMALSANTPVNDIESPEGRIKTMNILTQNQDPNDPSYTKTGEGACGPATIVAGVLYAEGRKGLKTLLAATQEAGKEPSPEVKALQDKLEKDGDKLTVGDLQELQRLVYTKLNSMEGDTDPEALEKQIRSDDPKEKAKAFVKPGTINKFLKEMVDEGDGSKRSLLGMFQNSHLDISAVDNTGDDKPDHFVLRIADDKDNAVAYYDPWMKKGTGGQIVNAQDGQMDGMGRSKDPTMDDYKQAGAEGRRVSQLPADA
jgi:hypothetical protein